MTAPNSSPLPKRYRGLWYSADLAYFRRTGRYSRVRLVTPADDLPWPIGTAIRIYRGNRTPTATICVRFGSEADQGPRE